MKHGVAVAKCCDMRAPPMEITTNSNLTIPIMHINNDPSIAVAGAGLSTPDVVELQSNAGIDYRASPHTPTSSSCKNCATSPAQVALGIQKLFMLRLIIFSRDATRNVACQTARIFVLNEASHGCAPDLSA